MMLRPMTSFAIAAGLVASAMAQTAGTTNMEIQAYADAYNKGPVTNQTAKKLLDESLAIDEAEAKLKSASAPKILAALPATKAARYIQIEDKTRTAVRYELVAGIPLVE